MMMDDRQVAIGLITRLDFKTTHTNLTHIPTGLNIWYAELHDNIISIFSHLLSVKWHK